MYLYVHRCFVVAVIGLRDRNPEGSKRSKSEDKIPFLEFALICHVFTKIWPLATVSSRTSNLPMYRDLRSGDHAASFAYCQCHYRD